MKGLVRFLLVVFLIHYFLFDSIISYSGVTVINFPITKETEIIPEILQHSNDSHLYKEGLRTKYNGLLI